MEAPEALLSSGERVERVEQEVVACVTAPVASVTGAGSGSFSVCCRPRRPPTGTAGFGRDYCNVRCLLWSCDVHCGDPDQELLVRSRSRWSPGHGPSFSVSETGYRQLPQRG